MILCRLISRVFLLLRARTTVTKGEEVRIVRTPKNKFDNNACNVATIAGDIFGSVPSGLCAQISPLLDRKEGDFTVEAVMLEGHGENSTKVYELAMELKLTFPFVRDVRNVIPQALVMSALQYGSTAPIVEQRQAGKRTRGADDSSDEEPLHKRRRQGHSPSVTVIPSLAENSSANRPDLPAASTSSEDVDKALPVVQEIASTHAQKPATVVKSADSDQVIYGARPENDDPRVKFTRVEHPDAQLCLRWWPGDERECFFDVVEWPDTSKIFDQSTLSILTFRVDGAQENLQSLEEIWESVSGERVEGDRRWCVPLGSVLKRTFQRHGMDRPTTTSVSCPFAKDGSPSPFPIL
ncbi:hypothetical protein EXIGLDRAFT_752411 [Exidia glandulosa HHB12029]|uniref:HIRAN domain-containing protein n=1 Tax=Exidia glandulosa HHB12029 TaxID=1314781 RepID=A0A165EKR5_EXIGL|nr:hypothetical protein EXIGLDRAFT_752411 [Exidia glandulosa HHB12029]